MSSAENRNIKRVFVLILHLHM